MTRRVVLTKEVLAEIPALVEQGMHKGDIAKKFGCKLSTLQVRCSQAGISLSAFKRMKVKDGSAISLSYEASKSLRARAAASGFTASQLAGDLLEIIARDDLYDAVLDLFPLRTVKLDQKHYRIEPEQPADLVVTRMDKAGNRH